MGVGCVWGNLRGFTVQHVRLRPLEVCWENVGHMLKGLACYHDFSYYPPE